MNPGTSHSSRQAFRRIDGTVSAALLLALLSVVIVDRASLPTGADIVFLIDQRPVMVGMRTAIRERCRETARSLHAQGLDCQFAVIPFGGRRSHVPQVALTADLESFDRLLAETPPEEPPEDQTAAQALERALSFQFRESTPVLFYLVSRTPCTGQEEIKNVAGQMQDRGIITLIQAGADARDRCQPLLNGGGRFYAFDGKDLTGTANGTNASARTASLVAKLSSQSGVQIAVNSLYGDRTSAKRQEILTRNGGTQESESAARAGLAWLARHQADDGHWSDHDKCEQDACPTAHFKYGAVYAETGLALLAFQAGGHYAFNQQEHSDTVRRGLDWLVAHQQQDGSWFGTVPHDSWYQHGMATFALAEACAVAYANQHEPDPRYLAAAERAVALIEKHQYTQGGWQYALDSGASGDTSVSGWQVLALKSAIEAEIPVQQATMDRVLRFFEKCGNPATGVTGYTPGGHATELTTSLGLIVQHFVARKPDSELAQNAARHLQAQLKQGGGMTGDFYKLYNGTLAMFLAGGEKWTTWNNVVRDSIIAQQSKTGCARGSWSGPTGHLGVHGRTLDTAWAVLILEVYYRYKHAEAPQ